MTVTTPGEKGFERKTPIGRVFTKAEILGGGKRRKEGGGGGLVGQGNVPSPALVVEWPQRG